MNVAVARIIRIQTVSVVLQRRIDIDKVEVIIRAVLAHHLVKLVDLLIRKSRSLSRINSRRSGNDKYADTGVRRDNTVDVIDIPVIDN